MWLSFWRSVPPALPSAAAFQLPTNCHPPSVYPVPSLDIPIPPPSAPPLPSPFCHPPRPASTGEAPEEVRNCFQQRSRWSKGHSQVFFSRHNPVMGPGARGLSLLMRWLYGSVILSYFSAFLSTPLLMLVPMITVGGVGGWGGGGGRRRGRGMQ